MSIGKTLIIKKTFGSLHQKHDNMSTLKRICLKFNPQSVSPTRKQVREQQCLKHVWICSRNAIGGHGKKLKFDQNLFFNGNG